MKKYLNITLAIVLVLFPTFVFGAGIKASAAPLTATAVQNQQLAVPVTVDITNLPEKLGSYTATLRWNSRVLQFESYQPGSTAGFSSPVVNISKAPEGLLTFAAANPYGAEGNINILNVVFQVIGEEGAKSDLALNFTAMAAAGTFTNLLPYLNTMTGVEHGITVGEQPKDFSLQQNFPNPFNPSTKIGYSIPRAEHVSLTVYNALGQIVRILVNERKGIGNYAITWDGRDEAGKDVPIGIYIYKLQAGNFSDTKKMHLVK